MAELRSLSKKLMYDCLFLVFLCTLHTLCVRAITKSNTSVGVRRMHGNEDQF